MKNIKYYDVNAKFDAPERKFTTKFSVTDEDTIAAIQRHPGSCCLNFASHKRPGGGYKAVWDLAIPIKTQEEDLFRRSDLPAIMDTPEVRKFYPLRKTEGIYCTATVQKDARLKPIDPFPMSVVTVPALVCPQPHQRDITVAKLRRVLDIAAENGHSTLVLGAWGCGVFRNDPKDVTSILKGLLAEDFKGVFETIVFAVPGQKTHNFQVFKEAFEG